MTKKRLIILVTIIVFLVVPLVSFIIYSAFFTPPEQIGKEIKYVDKDTGEEVSTFEGVSPERDGNTSVLLLGMGPLNDDLLKTHFIFVKEQIDTYSKTRLNSAFDKIALLPAGYTQDDDGTITGNLRLGIDDQNIVPITIYSSLITGDVRVVIGDPQNKFGGQYDSGTTTFYAD